MSVYDIARFMRLGGQTVPDGVDKTLNTEELLKFWERVDDELQETWDAICYPHDEWGFSDPHFSEPPRDIPEVVDGFLDIAYTALSAAIRVAGEDNAYKCWWEVIQTNLNKVNGAYGPVVRNPETGKIEKPAGWQGPKIKEILGD